MNQQRVQIRGFDRPGKWLNLTEIIFGNSYEVRYLLGKLRVNIDDRVVPAWRHLTDHVEEYSKANAEGSKECPIKIIALAEQPGDNSPGRNNIGHLLSSHVD